MRAGRAAAAERGIPVHRGERVSPLGDGWLIHQRKGFQPCPWAFDLARFVPTRPGDRVLDLGCGTGALAWALAQVQPALRRVVGVELEPTALDQARRNALLAGHDHALVVRADVRTAPVVPRAWDVVVSNPPFYQAGSGRESAHRPSHGATHALDGDVADFAQAGARALAPHGRLAMVFDGGRTRELLLALADAGLTVRSMRFLDDDRGIPSRVLALAGHDGAGLTVDRKVWRPS